MKTKKPRVSSNPIEYRLLVTPQLDEQLQEVKLVITIRTIKEFTNFQYELVVTDTLAGDTLSFNIVGLRAPKTNVPRIGFAFYTKAFDNPVKIKKIVVKKMDKKENIFTLRISNEKAVVKSSPEDAFIEIITEHSNW